MKVYIYKEDMQKKLLYQFLNDLSYKYYIEHHIKFKVLEILEDKIFVEVPENEIREELYKDKIWYKHVSGKIGIFKNNEEWKIMFQR